MRKGLNKVEKDLRVNLGTGSEIYYISYVINGIKGNSPMCPNNVDFFWKHLKRKHKVKTVKDFSYKIVKQVGKSLVY